MLSKRGKVKRGELNELCAEMEPPGSEGKHLMMLVCCCSTLRAGVKRTGMAREERWSARGCVCQRRGEEGVM